MLVGNMFFTEGNIIWSKKKKPTRKHFFSFCFVDRKQTFPKNHSINGLLFLSVIHTGYKQLWCRTSKGKDEILNSISYSTQTQNLTKAELLKQSHIYLKGMAGVKLMYYKTSIT